MEFMILCHDSGVADPIIITGAGLAGLTLACGLVGRGHDVVILERTSDYSEVGAGISLWPNALASLDAIGVGDEVREVGQAVASGGVQRPDGSWIRSADSSEIERALGEPMLAIYRADLLGILASHVPENALRFNAELTTFEVTADGVLAHLGDGQAVEGRAIVGADGIGSRIARWLDPTLSRTYSGYTAWRGVAPINVSNVLPSETWGRGCEFGFLPIGSDRTYWFATENVAEGSSYDPNGERQYLQKKFEHWHKPIPSLIAGTDAQNILRHDICDRTTISTWSIGPVAVIGDAAHPMRPHMGQGGCQAIEDGVLLANSLGPNSDVASAFVEFAQKRSPRVNSIVRQSAVMGRAIQGEGLVASAARQLGRRIPMKLMVRNLSRIGGRSAFERASSAFSASSR